MKAPRLKSYLLTFFSVANLWFLRSVGALAQADGAKASPKTAGRNFRRATAPNFSGKKFPAGDESKTPAGRNFLREMSPNFSGKKFPAGNEFKLQQEEISCGKYIQNFSGKKFPAGNEFKLQQEEISERE
jgi:hypothetical protein